MAVRKMRPPSKTLPIEFPLLVHGKDKKKNDILLGQVADNLKVANKIKQLAKTLPEAQTKISAIRVAKIKLCRSIGYVWILVGGIPNKERIFHYVVAGFDSSSYHTEPIVVEGVDLRKYWIDDFASRWEKYSVSAGYISDYEKDLIREWMDTYVEQPKPNKQLDPSIEVIDEDDEDVPVYAEPELENFVPVAPIVETKPQSDTAIPKWDNRVWIDTLRTLEPLVVKLREGTMYTITEVMANDGHLATQLKDVFKSTTIDDVVKITELILDDPGSSHQILLTRYNPAGQVTLSVIVLLFTNGDTADVEASIVRPQSKLYRQLLMSVDNLFDPATTTTAPMFAEFFEVDDLKAHFLPVLYRYISDRTHMAKFVTKLPSRASKPADTINESSAPVETLKIDPSAKLEEPKKSVQCVSHPVTDLPIHKAEFQPSGPFSIWRSPLLERSTYVAGDRDFGTKINLAPVAKPKTLEFGEIHPVMSLEPTTAPAKVLTTPAKIVAPAPQVETVKPVQELKAVPHESVTVTDSTTTDKPIIDLFEIANIEATPFQSGMIFLGRDKENQTDYYLSYYTAKMLSGELVIELVSCARTKGFSRLNMTKTVNKILRDNFVNTLTTLNAATCKAAYTDEQLAVILEWLKRNVAKND